MLDFSNVVHHNAAQIYLQSDGAVKKTALLAYKSEMVNSRIINQMKTVKTSTSERKKSFEWTRPDTGLRQLCMTALLLSLISTAEGQFIDNNPTLTQSPQVQFASAYLGVGQGFTLYPNVGTPTQQINGSPAGMTISLDTSPYFAITTTDCSTCQATYNPASSSTYQPNSTVAEWFTECIGEYQWYNESFTGVLGTETLCIPTAQGDACLPNFGMAFISSETSPTSLLDLLGIFLLQPVVQSFYNQGTISSQTASLVLTPNFNTSQSFVSFGGTPTDAVTGPSTTHQAFQDNGWCLSNVTGFTFGGKSFYNPQSPFQLEPTYPQIMLTNDAWNEMVNILQPKGFVITGGLAQYNGPCTDFSNSEMPVLSFTIDDMIYNLPWSAYSEYGAWTNGTNLCTAGVSVNPGQNADTTTILGDTFINNFVTQIDFVQTTLTFTQNAYFVSAGASVTPVSVPVPVVAASEYRGPASGFALTPYVGVPMQQIYLNNSPIAGMAISLGTSPYFAITTSNCGNCQQSFNPANSATYNTTTSSVTWDFWGFGNSTATDQSLTGDQGTETLCIYSSQIDGYECIPSFEMVFITSENNGTDYLDWLGIFLLQPVVQSFYNQGTIPSQTASLVFTPNFNTSQSFVSFGGTPTDAVTGPSTTHQAFQNNGWFLSNVTGFTFGGNSYYNSSSAFQLEPSYPQIMLTTGAWNDMINILQLKGFVIDGDLAQYNGTCTELSNSDMPVLSFTIDNMIYSLPWSAYSEYGAWTNGTNLCTAGVSVNPGSNADTTTILGDTFINNFVTQIDFVQTTLTFTQNAYFVSAGAIATPSPPTPVPVPEVVADSFYLGPGQGFAISPYVGVPMQQIYLDLAGMAISLATSPYFAITTSYCGNCQQSFNPANSATYNANVNGSSVTWDFYQYSNQTAKSFTGPQGTETLCIPTDGIYECITDFDMVFITSEDNGLNAFDLLGFFLLQPVAQKFYNQGTIPQQTASLVFNQYNPSFVTFGGTPANATTGQSTTHQAFQNNGWFLSNVTSFTFDGSSFYNSSSAFQLEPSYGQIMLTTDAWNTMAQILINNGFQIIDGTAYYNNGPCSYFLNSGMPFLSFQIDNMIYTLPWSAYSQSQTWTNGTSFCVAGVSLNPSPNAATTTILGATFITNFVTEIDFANSTLTFTQNVLSVSGGAIVTPAAPTPVPVPLVSASAAFRGPGSGFTINPYVGLPMQEIYQPFTGMAISLASSPYFAIATTLCGSCSESFNPANSATFNPNVQGSFRYWEFTGDLNYETYLQGFQGTETLCIPAADLLQQCITDFEMVFITNEYNDPNWLGIFLLEPVVQGFYSQGTISSMTASLVFDQYNPSYVSFGGTPANVTTGPSSTHQAIQNNGWFLNMTDFTFDGNSYYNSSSALQLEPSYAQIMLTTDAWNSMSQILKSKGFEFDFSIAMYQGPCTDFSNSDMPVLSFTIDNMIYSLPWSAYSQSQTWTNGTSFCAAGVSLNSGLNAANTTILGDTFIANFVTEIDFVQSTLTFTQSAFQDWAGPIMTPAAPTPVSVSEFEVAATYQGPYDSFTINPYVGLPMQHIMNGTNYGMVISLGTSPYFATTTNYCGNCYESFNPTKSATYNPNISGSSVSLDFWMFVGDQNFTGIQGTETLCIPFGGSYECISDFDMVFITSANSIDDYPLLGIFSLEPVVKGFYNQGTISSQTASLVFTPNQNTTQSFVSFGGTPANSITGTSTTHSAFQNNGWFLSNVTGFTVDGKSYYSSSSAFQLDPSSPQIMLTTDAWNEMQTLLTKKGFTVSNNVASYTGQCTDFKASKMPVISFTIDNMTYNLPWSAYSLQSGGTCVAGVSLNPQPNAATTTILGDTFIFNFVTEINFANSTLTFTQNANFVSGGASVATATNKLSAGGIVGISIGAVVLLVAIVAISFYCIRRRKAAEGNVEASTEDNEELISGPPSINRKD